MIILNYFDLGLAKDSTMIDNIINLCNNNIKLNIYAFEATYDFYLYNKDKYFKMDNVNIYHNAVTDIDNQNIKIYKWGNGYGNTIYSEYEAKSGKPNVENYEIVQSITLSNFIKRTGIYKAYILFKSILKVIKYNNFYCKKMLK